MANHSVVSYIEQMLQNLPSDWVKLTTHRLDIYNEDRAKSEFLEGLEKLYQANNAQKSELESLPTAYDYIRLGHPLSSVLEWALAKMHGLAPENVISFSSVTIPIMAVLRTNLLAGKATRIASINGLPSAFSPELLQTVYGYNFTLEQVASADELCAFEGSTVLVANSDDIASVQLSEAVDFYVSVQDKLGSIIFISEQHTEPYVSAIQHVRRRETIAMTPANCHSALKRLTGQNEQTNYGDYAQQKAKVLKTIAEVTATETKALLGSCGLSVQYAIMMGLIDHALQAHPGKEIKIIVPPNCYGGTNDQARRVAAAHPKVEVMDLPVDGENDMVRSTEQVLAEVAAIDAIPYIIAEIPTNPRVEVPNLQDLRAVLSKKRETPAGQPAISPVFILDQTFCPNVQFLSEEGILSSIQTISYVSGSKFPSGGKCTAGYCVANAEGSALMPTIEKHLQLCDNEATELQVALLAEQMPSMNHRIDQAYKNTREFVNFIRETLPAAKINFVSEQLAEAGFTPSVFSLDLTTKGNTAAEREAYKRALNKKLIDSMIGRIPNESKYCVSYGQLKGCYWTIPATSTQGTTKEEDKDYIARVSVSPDLDLERHKMVFADFVKEI